MPTVPVPDRSADAAAFIGPRLVYVPGDEAATRRASFFAVKAWVVEQRKTDDRWGLLLKPAGDNVDGFAADIALYRISEDSAQVVDVVSNAEGAPDEHGNPSHPSPAWSAKDVRPLSQWRAPNETPAPGPTPPPVTGGHGAALDAQIKALLARIEKLEAAQHSPGPAPSIDGLKITLKSEDGLFLCADPSYSGRESAGPWETFTIEVVK